MSWYEYVIHAVVIFIGVLLGNLLWQKLTIIRARKKTEKEGD